MKSAFALALIIIALPSLAAVKDTPFKQDVAVRLTHASQLNGASYKRLLVDRDDVAYVLTDRGVARLFETTVALDRSYRPLTGKAARDLVLGRGWVHYLFEDRWLSNGDAGKLFGRLPTNTFLHFAVADDGIALLSAPDKLSLFQNDRLSEIKLSGTADLQVFAFGNEFFALSSEALFRVAGTNASLLHRGTGFTTLAFHGREILVGTHDGYYAIDAQTGVETLPRQTRLPVTDITRIVPDANGLWFGTTRGAFHRANNGQIRYYASKRWLIDDYVVDLALDREGSLLALTKSGLNKIEFRTMTLHEKADWYDRKLRQRHIRFGFTGERRLTVPGDITSSEMIDTDNDGGWTSYYLSSQAFRFAVTGEEEAYRHAWESFTALERLRTITPIPGFFARTFERRGFKYSDPDRWREAADSEWEWKGHTSSDEFTSHTYAHAVLYECAARTDAERHRIATNYEAIITHILDHNLYLVDVDNEPTLWGRWNPEYVNWYPPTIHDRRLNSAEIIAGLQLAWKLTGKDVYRQKAYELFDRHGYLTNITTSMTNIAFTPGYVFRGNDMGNEWNHSDDELAFFCYWVLHRFAFTRELRSKYADAIAGHWRIEQPEKYPIWNFIYAGCGGRDCDAESAVWTLRGTPLDTITWSISNSHRKDVTKLPANFLGRELAELLPPGERLMARINTQPFILDHDDGGRTELPGDEYLLGYWLGRYLKQIRD